MTLKYCPHCDKIGHTRTMPHYIQVPWNGIMVKQRRIIHMVEEGGCGLTWYTAELPWICCHMMMRIWNLVMVTMAGIN